MKKLNLNLVPSFCAHEHWGSISPIGMAEEGFRADTEAGATPIRRTSVWDIVLDPYLGGWIGATGTDPDTLACGAGASDFLTWWAREPNAALDAVRPHLGRQLLTGAFQCLRAGILELHGADIASLALEEWRRADESIAARYADMFTWYRQAMDTACFSELVRPVHPEFYFRRQSDADANRELAFTRTVMRIDPLLTLWPEKCPRRDALARLVGVEPRDAASWRAFLSKLFDYAAEHGAIGIKQLQAYSRRLEYTLRDDAGVMWSGALSPEQALVFQDWVVHECCRQAHERKWPHQAHVGTHNLTQSSPMPLQTLAGRYAGMKLIMIHCWPFLAEAGWLAKHVANIYIDTCWTPVLNPEYFRQAVMGWINYVPSHKIMCSHDSTSIEMAVGSALFTRQTLATILSEQASALVLDPGYVKNLAVAMLHDNAVQVCGIGKAVRL